MSVKLRRLNLKPEMRGRKTEREPTRKSPAMKLKVVNNVTLMVDIGYNPKPRM